MKNTELMIALTLLALANPTALMAADVAAAQTAVPSYVSGGIGDEELTELRSRSKTFNLRLLFAEKYSGSYMAGVKVSIESVTGNKVLDAEGAGPLFYANLPAGSYRITVEAEGQRQSRIITIPKNASREWAVYWAPLAERR